MPSDPFYWGMKWRQTRTAHLRMHPYCSVCAAIFVQTPGVEVDHVVAKERVMDPYEHSNLRTLCKLHHGQKTSLTEGRHRNGKKRFQVIGLDGWPMRYGEGNDEGSR